VAFEVQTTSNPYRRSVSGIRGTDNFKFLLTGCQWHSRYRQLQIFIDGASVAFEVQTTSKLYTRSVSGIRVTDNFKFLLTEFERHSRYRELQNFIDGM
jgi:hypothetical protein